MNLITLAWKNLWHKPLQTLLSLILFALGVGLISLLFQMQHQVQRNFEKNLAGVDLVIGAKGSPLQMILSSMYHIDAPTGNIAIKDVTPFMRPTHPLISDALPLSMGDSYKGYRIVGTTHDIQDWYDLQMAKGDWYYHDYDVVIGAAVAEKVGLALGSRFKSSHGLVDDEGLEHDDMDDFVVAGILAPSGTIVDQLILTTPQTYWHVHDHDHDHEDEDSDDHTESEAEQDHDGEVHDHGHDQEDHDHHGHDHEGHDHDTHAGHHHQKIVTASLLEEDPEGAITNLLVKFKGRNFQALNMQRSINENTDMQAATPAIEINRLFSMMNSAEQMLRILAMVIIFVSGLSIFISLFSSLRERRYELSLMRVMGGQKGRLFMMIIMEGLLLAFLGYVLGMMLSHIGMGVIGSILAEDYRYDFTGAEILMKEWLLLPAALLIGFVASLLPAVQASNTDISDTLTKG